VGVGYFHVNQKRGVAGRRPAASSGRHCVVYLGLETHAQIERLIVRDGREFGSGSSQLIPRRYVAISVNSNSSSWAFSVIRQYSKSVNGHA